jgi:hypothetical protein
MVVVVPQAAVAKLPQIGVPRHACGNFANANDILTIRAEKLGTDIISETPNDLVATTLRKLVRRE